MSVDSGAMWTPGRAQRSAAAIALARGASHRRPWIWRILLALVLAVGAWALLAVWSASAHADPGEPLPCVDLPPATCSADAPSIAGSSDSLAAAPPDSGVPAPPVPLIAPVAGDPAPVPDADMASADETVPPQAQDGAAPTVHPPVAPADPAVDHPAADTSPDPALLIADIADVADSDPAATIDPDATGLVDPALVDHMVAVTPRPAEPLTVPITRPDVAPPLCDDPEPVLVALTGAAAPASAGMTDPSVPTRERPAATRATAASPAPVDSATTIAVERRSDAPAAPAAPAPPPSPARLPAPLPAHAPAGSAPCPSTTASGTGSSGSGQTDHVDLLDAVLEARVAASLAQAAVRPSSGFAGVVVGGADDPGVRPG